MWDQVLCLPFTLLGPPPLTQSGDAVLKIRSHIREIQEDVCQRGEGGEITRRCGKERKLTMKEAGEGGVEKYK